MKKRPLIIAAAALAVAVIAGVILMQRSSSHLTQTLGVPSYFAPGADWDRLNDGVSGVGAVIINPSSGPGNGPDPRYAAEVERSKAHGIAVLGYVATDHGQRDISEAIREIDAYSTWYGVNGIFFDQASTDCASVQYYARLRSEVKALGGTLTVLNPGMMTEECFMDVADIIVTFENTYRVYTVEYSAPKWVAKYDATRFWHLIYGASTEAEMRRAIALAKARKAKWVYVTSESLPNPWSMLPEDAYWHGELDVIK